MILLNANREKFNLKRTAVVFQPGHIKFAFPKDSLTALALEASELNLRTLIETIPDLIWVKDPQGVYLSCNQHCEQIMGAKAAEIIGKRDSDFYDPSAADQFRMSDQAAMAAGKPIRYEEVRMGSAPGSRQIFETIKTPMNDPGGRRVGVLGIARDITQRKQTEENLVQSETYHKQMFESSPIALVIQDFSQVTAKGGFHPGTPDCHEPGDQCLSCHGRPGRDTQAGTGRANPGRNGSDPG